MSGYTAIFDIDGTLVRSNDEHARSWVEAFAEFGYEVPFAQVRPLIGMGADNLLPRLAAGLNGKGGLGKRIAERRAAIFAQLYLPGLKPTPGARDLLVRLREEGIRCTVATSARGQELEGLLRAAHVADLIGREASSTADDAGESKPSPDIVTAALSKAGIAPGEALMVGDTPYDVEAASAANVRIIALRSGGWSDKDFDGALAVYDDPADLLAHYGRSPFALLRR